MPWLNRVAFAALVLSTPLAHAQRVTELLPTEEMALEAPCLSLRCYLKVSALDGNTAAATNVGTGAAVLVRQPGGAWSIQQSMQNPDYPGTPGQPVPFHGPLGLSGDWMLVPGTSRKYNFKTVVYAWNRSGETWLHTQVLALVRPAAFDTVSITSIVMNQNTVAISATRGQSTGSERLTQIDVFVRRADGRFQQQALLNPPTGQGSSSGYALALDSGRLLVGDPQASNGAGRVYVYGFSNSSGWTLRHTLAASDGNVGANFGAAVSISGNTLAVGAPGRSNFDVPDRNGGAYLFQRTATGWAQTQVLVRPTYEGDEPETEQGTRFGGAVALSGDRLIVRDQVPPPDLSLQPLAFLYERRGVWAPVAALTAQTPLSGNDVFLSGSTAIVDGFESVRYAPDLSFDLPELWTLPPRVP